MTFEWTVNVGNLITAVGLLTGFFVAHVQNVKKLQDIETKIALMYTWFVGQVINNKK